MKQTAWKTYFCVTSFYGRAEPEPRMTEEVRAGKPENTIHDYDCSVAYFDWYGSRSAAETALKILLTAYRRRQAIQETQP